MNNIRKRLLDVSLSMLYRQFIEEYGGIAIYGDRSEDSASAKAFYDDLAELPKAVSDLAGCSDAAFYSSSRKLLSIRRRALLLNALAGTFFRQMQPARLFQAHDFLIY